MGNAKYVPPPNGFTRWKGGEKSRLKLEYLQQAMVEGLTSHDIATRLNMAEPYIRTCARSAGIILSNMQGTRSRVVRNLLVPWSPPPEVGEPEPPPSRALLALAPYDTLAKRALDRKLGISSNPEPDLTDSEL